MKIIISIISVVILACLPDYQKAFFNVPPSFIYAGLFSVFALLVLRRIIICMLKSKAVYAPKEFLGKNRPFYINETKWEDICSMALEQKKDHDRFCGHINNIKSYVSSTKKLDCVDDEEWRSLIHKAFGQ